MADPRFYDNRGPFTLAEVCRAAGAALPAEVDGGAKVHDLASLTGAGPGHLTFYAGGAFAHLTDLAETAAGFCFVPQKTARPLQTRAGLIAVPAASVQHAFAAAALLFYPESSLVAWTQQTAVDPTAVIGTGVLFGPGVVVGPGAEIGDGTRIGPNTVIGRGVAIGRACEIGSNCTLSNAYLGDEVVILPGAQIGQPGFGFASGSAGHVKIPQLGRVIIQDRVEIGACTTIDRGALGDTVIGEGSKIDNLVQVGHNVHLGRHDIVVGQVGISGSCVLGDFVIVGGQAGLGDHTRIGNGARIAARSATPPGSDYPGGADYGGAPTKPVREWIREMHVLTNLAKKPKRDGHG
ncbi:MAG TPA: UDP-3-O-(3-hydroxymyristoyl)glucosamine N-acyltransferase [Rhizomicrobium sp.]|jgi:UDP-3-O-[3-hydroxymyristoyl] glucosamine N-acyltransferase|nr:UDP-3-O-(3-hydroxymyristoyl)glucosamine N-acyltransferase [Rhizomicrobium sp.]